MVRLQGGHQRGPICALMVPGSALRPARPQTPPEGGALVRSRVTSHGLSLRLEPSGGVSAALLHFPAGNTVLPRKLTVLRQVVLCSQSRRVAQIVVEAVGRANVLRASARHREVTPMTDKISQQPVPPLDPPERFAGGEVVAAARCPVDVSTYPRRHVIVVKHAGERQTFSVHEVAHNHVEWVGGQGHYKLGYAAVIRLMAEKVVGRA